MRLIKQWDADPKKAYELQNSFQKDENGFVNSAFNYSYQEFLEYVQRNLQFSQGRQLPLGFVPCTVYILEDDQQNYVGIFNLRHYLNEALENGAGHIGFGISPFYRGKNYATKGLSLLLEEAKKLGIKEAYLSVHKDNPASLKVQLKNQAIIDHGDHEKYYTRIKL